jgi:hypothetical protein
MRKRSAFFGSRWISVARPRAASPRMTSHVVSSSHPNPWRAERWKAWCVLCQPSPHARRPTHQRFRESSFVRQVAPGVSGRVHERRAVEREHQADEDTPRVEVAHGGEGGRGRGTPAGELWLHLTSSARTSPGRSGAQSRAVVGRPGRAGRLLVAPATLPPASGWAWRSAAGSTSRGGRGSRLSCGSWSSTSRNCCESGPPASRGPRAPAPRGRASPAGVHSSAGFSSTASRGCGARGAVAVCSSPSPAADAASAPPAGRRSSSCGPSGGARSCSLPYPTATPC